MTNFIEKAFREIISKTVPISCFKHMDSIENCICSAQSFERIKGNRLRKNKHIKVDTTWLDGWLDRMLKFS